VIVRHVLAHEWPRLKEIRLLALETDPAAYGSTYESELARPDEWWVTGVAGSEAGETRRNFIIEDGERWLGLALVREDDDAPGDAVINAMWVAPEIRGQGYSRHLCEACIAWAREHGYPRITLNAKLDNASAIAAYRSAGFEPIRTEGDELVLSRSL
jgi:RimJ/RimL family protein N-acetyltransferase